MALVILLYRAGVAAVGASGGRDGDSRAIPNTILVLAVILGIALMLWKYYMLISPQ
jgi:hypothetical protein